MKKFKIFEEGRLNQSEMSRLVGGSCSLYLCTVTYQVSQCLTQHSNCTGTYASCTSSSSYKSCSIISPYSGSPGPAG